MSVQGMAGTRRSGLHRSAAPSTSAYAISLASTTLILSSERMRDGWEGFDKAVVDELCGEDADYGHAVYFAQSTISSGLICQASNGCRIEHPALPKGRFRKQRGHIFWRPFVEEAAVYRGAVGLLGPLPDVSGDQLTAQLLEQPLLREAAQFEVRGADRLQNSTTRWSRNGNRPSTE